MQIQLIVGGKSFSTSRETLLRSSSFFSGLLMTHDNDAAQACFFIDRDPTHFRHVLNFMRGSFTCPPTEREARELMCEADFYALQGLVTAIQSEVQRLRQSDVAHILGIIASRMG